jgi:PIN domain nuclease of toxin-antitoxin system
MNTPVLLDTCAAIWLADGILAEGPLEVLAERYRRNEPIFLSPISGWELGTSFAKGRLRSSVTPVEYLKRLVSLPGIRLADMPPELLMASSFLPGKLHKDPADRIIAATAREYGLTVMTRDRALLAYAKEGYLNALEC